MFQIYATAIGYVVDFVRRGIARAEIKGEAFFFIISPHCRQSRICSGYCACELEICSEQNPSLY